MKKKFFKDFAITKDGHNFKECINQIMNSIYFRKLADKTQVIISLTGPNVRTRLTHTIEVAKIAREMCNELGLNEDLAEAIALAHDIGHTPFGHVGERTLKEIMCGCDTLDGNIKVESGNFGFKHNLQSALLIKEIFEGKNLNEDINYVFWGVAAHSRMTYTPFGYGYDNEIIIHCKHCNKVFNCSFSNKSSDVLDMPQLNGCKYNIYGEPKKNNSNKLCCPWICARLIGGALEEELGGNSKSSFSKHTHCVIPCNFVNIWSYRREHNDEYLHFKYLFDYPFCNYYYIPLFYNQLINKEKNDYVSFEAIVVNIADEIAQRRQDFEDGIQLKLININDGYTRLKELISKSTYIFDEVINEKEIRENIKQIKDSEEKIQALSKEIKSYNSKTFQIKQNLITSLGHIVVDFLKAIYCLKMKKTYIKESKELDDLSSIRLYGDFFNFITTSQPNKDLIHFDKWYEQFNWELESNKNKAELRCLKYFLYDYLNRLIKGNRIELDNAIVNLVNKLLIKKSSKKITKNLEDVDNLKRVQKIIDNKSLEHSFLPYLRNAEQPEEKKNPGRIYFDDLDSMDLIKFLSLKKNISKSINSEAREFIQFKELYKSNSNQALMRFVEFEESPSSEGTFKKAISSFEDFYRDLILKSELVEKNDGKSAFIIKRLFKGYLSNPHQLPDKALEKIWRDIQSQPLLMKILADDFNSIHSSLKNSFTFYPGKNLTEISFNYPEPVENEGLYPKEIIVLGKATKKLKDYLKEKQIKYYKIREIIDNPILISSSILKQSLYRGITNYIASLTDREALSEYEKLYFTTVELG